jgi:archaellum biogenesis ATPase FlaH
MSNERDILAAACDNREAYTRIVAHLGTSDLTDTGRMVWDVIDEYYGRDPSAGYVQMDTLSDLVQATVTNPKHKETLARVVDGVRARNVSGLNVVHSMLEMKKEAIGAQLATAILGGQDTTELLAEYQDLADAAGLEARTEKEEPVFGWNPADAESEEAGDLIAVAPASLNARLAGGCMRGHHIILFARPEMGKTSFLANLAAGFLMQDLRVLYLGNEDPITDVRLRFLGRVIEWPRQRILEDRQGAFEVAMNTTEWANLGTLQISPGTPHEIEELVKGFGPDVLMIDQLRNIAVRTSKSDGMVQHLEAAAKAVRQIGIRNNCLVVSVTQAGDSASGKAILDMSDVDSSKTGIPAQADVMIGMGASHDDEAAGRRVLSLPKNKRSGRHDFFPVKADFAIGKFTSIGGDNV